MTEKMYIPATVDSVDLEANKGKFKGVALTYTTLKNKKQIDDFIFHSMVSKNEALKSVLKSLKPGDTIKVHKEKNAKGFMNTVAIYTNTATSGAGRTLGAGGADFNTRAARGQALNLAVSVAVAEGKHADDKFILSQVARFLKLGSLVQEGPASEATKEASAESASDDLADLFDEI